MINTTSASTAAGQASAPTPPRILVVEDEAIVAMDLQGQLQEMHYEVCGIADNG
jgi:AmiR/NasT family two-component response regulator